MCPMLGFVIIAYVLYEMDITVLGHMLARGSGSIVNIASVAARSAGAGGAVYSAAKAAVSMLSEGLRKETAGKVRVCVIYPGLTESELVESVTDTNIREYARTLCQRHTGTGNRRSRGLRSDPAGLRGGERHYRASARQPGGSSERN
jgi:NADP-dependent 3-hydroxy acid dehydrogenase YdfG